MTVSPQSRAVSRRVSSARKDKKAWEVFFDHTCRKRFLTSFSALALGSLISRHWLDCRHLGQHSLVSIPAAPRRASFQVLQLGARREFFPHRVHHPRGLAARFLASTTGNLRL